MRERERREREKEREREREREREERKREKERVGERGTGWEREKKGVFVCAHVYVWMCVYKSECVYER